MSNLGLSIIGSNNSKFRIYPFNSNNEIAYSIIINDSNYLMTFHYNEMIGIGTSEPIAKLNIHNGSIKITSNNTYKSINITNNSINFNNKAYINDDNDSNISIYGDFEIKNELILNEFRPIVNNWHRTTDNKPRFYFSNNSSTIFNSPNGYEWINLDNSNLITLNNNGYFGIGISNPYNNLHISSSNNYPIKISNTLIHYNGTFISLNTEPCEWSKCTIGHIRTSNYDIGDIIFAFNDEINNKSADITNEKIRITSKGFMGIGTNEPNTNLHINANQIQLKLTDNNSNGFLLGKSNNSFLINEDNTDLLIGSGNKTSIIINSNGNINIPLGIINLNEKKFINLNNSNINIGSIETNTIFNNFVGIGTIPIELFHVQGIIASINSNTSNHIRIFNDNSSGFLDIGSSNNNGLGIRFTNLDYDTNTNYIERFRIKNDGNVGIGNNNPITNLNDISLTIGNSSLINSSGNLIISKGSSDFKRHFKIGYGSLNYMTIGDYGSNNQPGIWKEQVRIHHNSPNHSLIIYETGEMNVYGRIYQNSDKRLKRNIISITNALDKIEKLNGVEYNTYDNDIKHIGLIAQEVEEIVPEVVNENNETSIKSIAYANLVPLLINAIKELNKKINDKN